MDTNNDYVINLVKEFIASPYSLSRFCFNKHLKSSIFRNQTLPYIKKNNPDLLQDLEQNIKEKEILKNMQIKNDIYKILNIIKTEPNFGLIDVCLNTNYDILELLNVCDNYLSPEDKILFRKNIRNLRTIYFFTKKEIENLVNSTFVFNINGQLVKISSEDIQLVLDFLIENDILLCNEALKDGCIKLYEKKLFPNKVK